MREERREDRREEGKKEKERINERCLSTLKEAKQTNQKTGILKVM